MRRPPGSEAHPLTRREREPETPMRPRGEMLRHGAYGLVCRAGGRRQSGTCLCLDVPSAKRALAWFSPPGGRTTSSGTCLPGGPTFPSGTYSCLECSRVVLVSAWTFALAVLACVPQEADVPPAMRALRGPSPRSHRKASGPLVLACLGGQTFPSGTCSLLGTFPSSTCLCLDVPFVVLARAPQEADAPPAKRARWY